ncbi:MAG: hypothetical protein ACOYL9_13045 [Ilumatobacteraceae bacterium]
MRLVLAAIFGVVASLGVAAGSAVAADPCPYGPASSPTATLLSATVNVGDNVVVQGAGFLSNTTVRADVSPSVPGFPKTAAASASGAVSFSFAAPSAGTYTITLTDLLTGAPPANGSACGGQATTKLTVNDAGSGLPTPTTVPGGSGSGAGGGVLPSTGSTIAPTIRAGLVALLAGAGLVMVTIRRRRHDPRT